ncbi:hypothetical protein IJ798_03490 [Candidatus Saccharibacteria bacterium]|nr:hypothetical protein [Candidatus Saccharibacteria bacterium]
MKIIERIKRAFVFPVVGLVLVASALFTPTPVFAEPSETPTPVSPTETGTIAPGDPNAPTDETTDTTETNENGSETDDSSDKSEDSDESSENATCYSQVGGLGWLLCPATAFLAKGIDTIYGVIEDFLVIEPISMEQDSPVFTIWLYVRNITNIVFILFLLVVIYSQVTGFGLSNYGIKKALPRLIIAAILVNLSFIICVMAVDVSNIVGKSLHDFLGGVAENAVSSGQFSGNVSVNFYDVFTTIAAGGVIGAIAVGVAGGPLGLLLALIPVILSGIIAVIIGLVTISLRQAIIILLVAIAPLAFVAYLLPNTEKWFKKWTNTFSQMLFFYPMFALLFGASKIASWIFISSANSMLGIILGLAVQVLPLFLALSLMKMAGSILGGVSNALGKLGDKANNGIRGFTEPYKNLAKQRQLNNAMRKPFNPLSGASWRAASEKRKNNLKFRQEQADKTQAGLQAEQLNALRRNQRVIGYDKNNQPIYTQLPIRRTNKYMDAEAEARETDLRNQADALKTENAYGALGDYLKENGIREGRAVQNAARMSGHYIDLRTQMDAKKMNDESDERFYNETVMKAAERYDRSDGVHKAGDLKNAAMYNRIVNGALGATGYSINQTTEESKRLADQARVSIIGDAYSRSEAQRSNNTKRFEAYMDKQVTKEVERQYEDMIKYDNIDGIIASHNILAKRGDYDKIASHMTNYMNSGKIKLGEDASNRLAMNFLMMKDAAPALARLGKFMNMETWAYTDGKRQTQEVTMEQYLTGTINEKDGNGNDVVYKTKINLASGLEGTPLKGIDRTAYAALEEITSQFTEANGYDVKSAVEARMSIENSMLPQEVSALPGFASGSEQIRSMVAHMTGMKFNSATGKWENNLKVGGIDPETGKWKGKTQFDVDVESQVTKQVMNKYLGALTARDLIMMKSDTWGGIVARLKMDKAAEANIDTSTEEGDAQATEMAYAQLREQLGDRITKLASGNMNVDMMKTPIYNALRIGERRQEIFLQREEERAIRNQQRRRGNGGNGGPSTPPPIPSADDGDGSDDETDDN